jgi:hypothetical protein
MAGTMTYATAAGSARSHVADSTHSSPYAAPASKARRDITAARKPPQDDHVHQGAILWLPPQHAVARKEATKDHRVMKLTGDSNGGRARDAAWGKDFNHPMLVLSRSQETPYIVDYITVSFPAVCKATLC